MKIPLHQIKTEEFVPVKTYMRCYAHEDHFTNQCSKPRDLKSGPSAGHLDTSGTRAPPTPKNASTA